MATVARNAPCPCGSGLKAKKCCGAEPVKRTPVNLAPEPARVEEDVPACDTYWVDARDSGAVQLVIGEAGEPLEVLQLTAAEADRLADDLRTAATYARDAVASGAGDDLFPVIYAEHLGVGVSPEHELEAEEPGDLGALGRQFGEIIELALTHPALCVELPAEDPRVGDLRTVARVLGSDFVGDVAMGFGPALFYDLVNELDTPANRSAVIGHVQALHAAGEVSAEVAGWVLEERDAPAHHEVEGSGGFAIEASVLAALSSSESPAR
jgi:hypothetical protein